MKKLILGCFSTILIAAVLVINPFDDEDILCAQIQSNAQAVKVVVPSLSTTTAITLNTSSPIEVTGNLAYVTTLGFPINTGALVYTVTIWNNDTTNDVFCSNDSAVAATGTTHLGVNIKHGSATASNKETFVIQPNEKWFCIAGGGTPVISILKQS